MTEPDTLWDLLDELIETARAQQYDRRSGETFTERCERA